MVGKQQAFGKLTVSQMLEAADPADSSTRKTPQQVSGSAGRAQRTKEDDFPVGSVQAVRGGSDHRPDFTAVEAWVTSGNLGELCRSQFCFFVF